MNNLLKGIDLVINSKVLIHTAAWYRYYTNLRCMCRIIAHYSTLHVFGVNRFFDSFAKLFLRGGISGVGTLAKLCSGVYRWLFTCVGFPETFPAFVMSAFCTQEKLCSVFFCHLLDAWAIILLIYWSSIFWWLSLFFVGYDVHFSIVLHCFVFVINTGLNMRFHTSVELQCHFDTAWLDLVNPKEARIYVEHFFQKHVNVTEIRDSFQDQNKAWLVRFKWLKNQFFFQLLVTDWYRATNILEVSSQTFD